MERPVEKQTIRDRIVSELKPYIGYSKHRDLISFCVCAEYFIDYSDVNAELDPDFNELIVVVEKKWLFNTMKASGIKRPIAYLQNEYTSDDSFDWYNEAVSAGKVVCVDFN